MTEIGKANQFRLIVAGSRTLSPSLLHLERWICLIEAQNATGVTEIVSGCCPKGVDQCGIDFAEKYSIPLKRFPADWDKHGKAAGPIRNEQMAKYGDALLLVWDGESKGSANMLKMATENKIPVLQFTHYHF